jgi:hypothetical protein
MTWHDRVVCTPTGKAESFAIAEGDDNADGQPPSRTVDPRASCRCPRRRCVRPCSMTRGFTRPQASGSGPDDEGRSSPPSRAVHVDEVRA